MKFLIPILMTLIFLGGNVYVFSRIWQAMPPSLIGRICLLSFVSIVVLSMFVAFLFDNVLPVGVVTFCFRLGTSWMILLLYFAIILLFQDLLGLANRLFHFMPSDALSRYTRDNWVGVAFTVGFVGLFMVCGYLKYQWKVRVPVSVTIDRISSDSLKFPPLRIVAISDLHLGYGIGKKEFEGWIEKINSENPDLVIIAGDIIDSNPRPLFENNYAESFSKIKAPMGVYACLGNHEYISGIDESIRFLKQTGITLLKDSVAEIDNRFYIVGRDDKMNSRRRSIAALLEGVDKSKPMILLDHQPFGLDEAAQNGIDIQFSGHTHGGQVWPISMITNSIYEMDHGHKVKGNTNVIVSSGIGVWGGKFRIGTQSEYVVIDINH